ncbi:hypothetical protein J891_0603 [Acinetobacter baumannii 44327_8]|uniref:hypothetical protein n=1 Tax=Acinetobacter baumannii TaxID=470 RepID=UPI000450D1A6|nr:hypothetical protein [Acinetobacter baumannii]EXI13266.1 hypothetical protein J611_3676 [Acinetobacter baumannii 655555]EXU30091.1 hypothetical protein J761_1289 [Acinetobacter baumannii 24845_8]EXV85025.1 hypothetical protein J832_1097 [Acinetobacter baumannii 25691_9]EXW57844.1 hypothetical protein J881_1054 [Acinetobacter baumannii 44467_8]EXW77656.1 hypothetical protein J876_1586 [Acinetobacter baumannii 44467_3]
MRKIQGKHKSALLVVAAAILTAASIATFAPSAHAAVSARASVSSARSVSVSRPSAIRSISTTPVRTSYKPPVSKPVVTKPTTPARTSYVSSSAAKKKRSTGPEYEYYAWGDCAPYSNLNFRGWKCLDRD